MSLAKREEEILRIKSASFHPQMNEALEKIIRANVLKTVRTTIELALIEELLVERKKMQSFSRRSGYYPRILNTQYGQIPTLNVPKLRSCNKEREWKVLERHEKNIVGMLAYASYLYVMGLSIRDLQMALYFLLGTVLSRNAINRVTLKLQGRLDEERLYRIERTPLVLIVDGVWVSVQYDLDEFFIDRSGHKRQKRKAQDRVLLAVMAIYADGSSHILHYELAENESQESWNTVFAQMIERGLLGEAVEVVVSDGTKGLLAAMKKHLPNAKQQRCITHKVRGMYPYLTYQDLPDKDKEGKTLTVGQAKKERWRQVKRDAYAIYDEPSLDKAQAKLKDFVVKWEAVEPDALHAFQWGIQRTFVFYGFDKELHPAIRTTNLLERFFRTFRNKADEIGAFPNETSCLTLFLVVLNFDHAKHNRMPPDMANTLGH